MNERIQELMAQAVTFRLDPDSNAYEALIHPEDLEVFALLIVRECVKNLETNKRCDIYTGELIDCDWNDVIQHQIVSLIEHFGVEL